MRRVALTLLVAMVACSGGGGASSPVTAPPMPTEVAGYTPAGELMRADFRVFGGADGIVLADLEARLHGECAIGRWTARWRAITGEVDAGYTRDDRKRGGATVRDLKKGKAGLLGGDLCEQPVFFYSGPDNGFGDVVVEYLEWRTAA